MQPRHILITILAALCVLGAYWYFSRAEAVRNYPSNGTDIIAFGDSLVEGVGASQGGDFVSLLSRKIGQPIINLGRSGDTTQDGLARLNALDAYRPKVVLLLLGGNDYLRRIPEAQTFENLGRMIGDMQRRGARGILPGVRGGILSDHFDSRFERMSEEYKTAYVSDVLDGLLGRDAYMSDEIHPNDVGYRLIAERIYPVLLPLLK